MAITFTHRLQGQSSTDAQASYTTASITPATDGSPIGLWILNARAVTTVPTVTSVAGLGLTWTAVTNGTQRDFGAVVFRISLWKGIGTASAGTVVLSQNASTATGVMWAFVQMPGADPVTPFLSANKIESTLTTAQTSTSLTLPSTPAVGNAVLAGVAHNAGEDITAGTNFTRGTNTANMASPPGGLNYEYKTILDTTVDASWATSSGYTAIGIEVAAASAAGGDSVGFIPI